MLRMGIASHLEEVERHSRSNQNKDTITVGLHMLPGSAPGGRSQKPPQREHLEDMYMHKSLSVNSLVAVTAQSRDSVMGRWQRA